MTTDPDFELVRRCQTEGGPAREAAFRKLFENHKDRVFNLAGRMLGNLADAEDVSQEAFVTVFRKIHEFRFSSRFYTWLYRIVFNLCVDRRRRGTLLSLPTAAGRDGANLIGRVEDSEPGPSEVLAEREERSKKMEWALRRLSDPLRAVVILRYLEDLPYDEISDVLGISLGTVKSRLSRAHEFLHEILANAGGSAGRSDDGDAAKRDRRGDEGVK